MPKPSKKQKSRAQYLYFWILKRHWRHLAVLSVLALVTGVTMNRIHYLDTAQKLGAYKNLACVGLNAMSRQDVRLPGPQDDMWVSSSVQPWGANFYDFMPDGLIGTHSCAQTAKPPSPRDVPKNLRDFGAYTMSANAGYFRSGKAAASYAAAYNKSRYWSVDDAGVKAGFPQSSLFTYIVTNAEKPYAVAYTARGTAFLNISMPCDTARSADLNVVYDICNRTAQAVLNQYAERVQAQLASDLIFD